MAVRHVLMDILALEVDSGAVFTSAMVWDPERVPKEVELGISWKNL